MRAFYDGLQRRRSALVARSTAQRRQLEDGVQDIRRVVTTPALVGAGVAITLLSSSPKLRWWLVRGWAAYAFVRRLLDR